MDLVESVNDLTRTFPSGEKYGLGSQMQRAAVYIPSNIAKGHTRPHRGEYLNFISIARSSLAELTTQLEIARRLGYAQEGRLTQIVHQMDSLGRQLRALRSSLTK